MIEKVENALNRCSWYKKFIGYDNFIGIQALMSDLLICAKNPYSSVNLLIDTKLKLEEKKKEMCVNDLGTKAYDFIRYCISEIQFGIKNNCL